MRISRLIAFARFLTMGYLAAFFVAVIASGLAQLITYPEGYIGHPPFSVRQSILLPILSLWAPWAMLSFASILLVAWISFSPERTKPRSLLAICVLIGIFMAALLMMAFIWPTPGNWFRASSWGELILISVRAGYAGGAAGLCVGAWAAFIQSRSHPAQKEKSVLWSLGDFRIPWLLSMPHLVVATIVLTPAYP